MTTDSTTEILGMVGTTAGQVAGALMAYRPVGAPGAAERALSA